MSGYSGFPPFAQMNRASWIALVCSKRRPSSRTMGLFAALLPYLAWVSPMLVHPQDGSYLNMSALAQLLEIDRQVLHKGLSRLAEIGLVGFTAGGRGTPKFVALNPQYVWFGPPSPKPKDRPRPIPIEVGFAPRTNRPRPEKARRCFSPQDRVELILSAGSKCQLCGAKAPDVQLEIHHVKPFAKGGETIKENAMVLCSDCNLGLSDREYPQLVSADD